MRDSRHRRFGTLAIIQARMESTRLPGKSLLQVAGTPLVEHVARRTDSAKFVDKTVFAIPDTAENNVLHKFISDSLGFQVYRGSSDDVLERFANIVEAEEPDLVVRITADDPLKDPALIDIAIKIMLGDTELDYVSNSLTGSFPEGLDVEVVKAHSLLEAAKEATNSADREHVTPFLWRQPKRYRLEQFCSSRDFSSWRWTLDTEKDLIFLDALMRVIPKDSEWYRYEKVVTLLESTPNLLNLMPSAPRSTERVSRQGEIGNE